ncbi:MAG: glycosyltransferase [Bacteroidales bacterium]|nr:glycosyltransferase [Bacteroidales bacterium]
MSYNKKKVLFIIESLSGGGAEKVLTTLVRNINQEKYNVTVCSIVNTGEYICEVKSCVNYKYILNKTNTLFGKVKYKLVYNILPLKLVYLLFVPKRNDIEVAFIEGFSTKLLSHSTNRHSKKIAWVHIDLMINHWTDLVYHSREEEIRAYQKFDKIICVSKSVKDSMSEFCKGFDNIGVLYNPIDSDEILNLSGKNCERSHFLTGNINLISIGRLVHQKGYDRLIPILKRLHDEGYDFVLNILGEGPDHSKLNRMIEENNMQKYISLMGFCPNPYPYLKVSDLFICSSRSEGYSTAVTEALILGVPVITTNCSGMNELLQDGQYGLITSNSEEALYEGIKQLLSSNELEYYSKKAEERGKEFSIERIMQLIEFVLS